MAAAHAVATKRRRPYNYRTVIRQRTDCRLACVCVHIYTCILNPKHNSCFYWKSLQLMCVYCIFLMAYNHYGVFRRRNGCGRTAGWSGICAPRTGWTPPRARGRSAAAASRPGRQWALPRQPGCVGYWRLARKIKIIIGPIIIIIIIIVILKIIK